MPFITQGKINLKYILIVVILAVIVGLGILGYQYWQGLTEVGKEFYYFKIAIVKKDETFCEKLHRGMFGLKDDCYIEVAAEKNDETLCEKTLENRRGSCYGEVAFRKGDTVCENVGEYKDSCYERLAEKMKDENICDKIAAEKQELCYMSVAVAKKDETVCNKIKDERMRDDCSFWVVDSKKKD